MYIEHPFKYDGVYYAKVDGELIEITREQAKVMLSFYRNYKNYDKKWGYRGEEDKIENEKERLSINLIASQISHQDGGCFKN